MRGAWLATVAAIAVVAGARLGFAASVPVFVDEAWYAWCARHLALAYSDLPGFTAWTLSLVVASEGSTQSWLLRLPTVVAGCALPWLVQCISAQLWPDRAPTWLPAMAVIALPMGTLAGVLALPDAWLLLYSAVAAWTLLALEKRPQRSLALLLGITIGLALATHPRALVIIASLGLYLWLRRSTWAARSAPLLLWVAIPALLGLLPTVLYNWQHELANLRFQWVDRHAYAFSAALFMSFWPIQFMLAGPLWAIVMALAGAALRGPAHQRQWAFFLAFVLGPLLGWWLVGSFADRERLSWHWTLSALVLGAALWPVIADRHRRLAATACALGVGGGAVLMVLLALPADRVRDLIHPKLYPKHFAGWDAIAAEVRARRQPEELLIADNFMLGAQLAYHGLEPAVVLDHPLNAAHGRAHQLAVFARDRSTLAALPAGRPLLLAIELSNTKTELQPDITLAALGLVDQAQLVSDGWYAGKRFVLFRGQLAAAGHGPASFGPLVIGYAHLERAATGPEVVGWLLGERLAERRFVDGSGKPLVLDNCTAAPESAVAQRCFFDFAATQGQLATVREVGPPYSAPVSQWVD